MTGDDRQAAEAFARDSAWLQPDPAASILERYPDATVEEVKALAAIAEQRVAEEMGVDETAPAEPPTTLTKAEQAALAKARELLPFVDGFGDAGHPELARRVRPVAEAAVRFAAALDDERRIRRQAIEARDRAVQVLERRAGEALTRRDQT